MDLQSDSEEEDEAIKAANELVGIGAAQGATTDPLLSQVDTLLAAIFGV